MNDPTAPIVQTATPVASLIQEAAALHCDVRQHQQKALDIAYKLGLLLLEAKLKCRHGEWLPTLEKHWPNSESLAQMYMQIARHWKLVSGAASIAEARRLMKEAGVQEEVVESSKSRESRDLPESGGGPSNSGGGRSAGTATSPPPSQGELDFTGENAAMKEARIAMSRQKDLAEEALAQLDALLEVLPKLATGVMGADFIELCTANGIVVKQEVTEKGQFVGTKLVAEETVRERFPQFEEMREKVAAFLKKFGAES